MLSTGVSRDRIMLDPSPAKSLAQAPLLQAIGIVKRYGTFLANDSIDIDLWPAEIHALLGENGAGKSTLVKIMYGLIQPSEGELKWMGGRLVLTGPADARALGIGMVFQHFSLFENLTVAENVALGLSPKEPFADIATRLAEVSARSQARGVAALGRRAPAHRDRAHADAGSQTAHSRRTDRGAHAAGGGSTVRRA
jgi:ABC-type sugar transport system ATPase subunit